MAGKITKEELHPLLSQKIDDFAAHEAESMPHKFKDSASNKTYRWGLGASNGQVYMLYEEAI